MFDETKQMTGNGASERSAALEDFKKAVGMLKQMGEQLFEQQRSLLEQLGTLKVESEAKENKLKAELKDRIDALDESRKQLVEARSNLADSKRNLASMAIQIQQMSETLSNYHHDADEIEQLNAEMRALRAEKIHLSATVEELKADAARVARLNTDSLDCLKLQFAQEKLVLHENMKAAEARVVQLQEASKKDQELIRQAEDRLRTFDEEMARVKREEKARFDKIRSDLHHHQSLLADQERAYQDLQKDLDRRVRAGILKTEQQDKSKLEELSKKLEETERQLRLVEFRMAQMAEDHQRALTSARTDYEAQLNMKVEEARRQFYAKTKGPKV